MRGVDLGAKVRNVERALGCEITTSGDPDAGELRFSVEDPYLGRRFTEAVVRPSDRELALRRLQSAVYQARGRQKFIEQSGLCAICGLRMLAYEIDHIKSRGANGRNDAMDNLRAVHSDCHRERHGG